MEAKKDTDLFEILGININATQEEIKRRYNELVLLNHPDKGGDAKKFASIQIAYKILSNEKNRELYTKSLSSTFNDISKEYHDHAFAYEKSENDFTTGKTEQEKQQKRDDFMKAFEDSRTPKEQAIKVKAQKEIDTKAPLVLSYQDLLKQEEMNVPVIPCLTKEHFDINMFNQMFEKNKSAQTTDVEPYKEIAEQTRTDLATIDDYGIFADSYDTATIDRDFNTYQTRRDLDFSQYDKSHDVTRTRDKVFENAGCLLEKMCEERAIFDKTAWKHPPPEFVDEHPMSYQQMLSVALEPQKEPSL